LADQAALEQTSWDRLPPFLAIPTTAGTGSEVGRSSVITLESTGAKSVIFSSQTPGCPGLARSVSDHISAGAPNSRYRPGRPHSLY
jgi:alcohol dehydrogenase class IV